MNPQSELSKMSVLTPKTIEALGKLTSAIVAQVNCTADQLDNDRPFLALVNAAAAIGSAAGYKYRGFDINLLLSAVKSGYERASKLPADVRERQLKEILEYGAA